MPIVAEEKSSSKGTKTIDINTKRTLMQRDNDVKTFDPYTSTKSKPCRPDGNGRNEKPPAVSNPKKQQEKSTPVR